MKKNYLLSSIILVSICSALLNTSCKKEEPATVRVIQQFSINVDNTPIETKSIVTKILTDGNDEKYLQIAANLTNGDIAYVEIYYNGLNGIPKIIVNQSQKGAFGYQANSQGDTKWYGAAQNFEGSIGEINIEKNDLVGRTITGTFSGTAVNISNLSDKKIITGGSFTVVY